MSDIVTRKYDLQQVDVLVPSTVFAKGVPLGFLPRGSIFIHPGSKKLYMKTNPVIARHFGLTSINLLTGMENDVFQRDTRVIPIKLHVSWISVKETT